MNGRGIYDPDALGEELDDLRRRIDRVRAVVRGVGSYVGPIPSLRSLEQRESELVARISLCVFPRKAGVS